MRAPKSTLGEVTVKAADVGDEIDAPAGVRCIKRAYDALDAATREVRS
jgi:hypothetical protein